MMRFVTLNFLYTIFLMELFIIIMLSYALIHLLYIFELDYNLIVLVFCFEEFLLKKMFQIFNLNI